MLTYPDIDPIAIAIGPLRVHWYGLMYLLGFAFAWGLGRWRASRPGSGWNADMVDDLIFYCVIGVIAGGRLGYMVFYGFDQILANPLNLIKVWEGGMSFHGGLLGVLAALGVYAWRHKQSFVHLGDLVASVAPLGLFLGRIANFINGELWGKESNVPWAVIFPQSDTTGLPVHLIAPRHPSQLYEAILEGLVLLVLLQWRFWRTDLLTRQPGRLAGEYLCGYAFARVICEVFREPDASLVLGLSRGTLYSLAMFAGGLWLVFRRPTRGA